VVRLEITIEWPEVYAVAETIARFDAGLPVQEWVPASIPLWESFPGFRDDVVMAVILTARTECPLRVREFAVNDIQLE